MRNDYNSDMLQYQKTTDTEEERTRKVLAKTFLFMFGVLLITAAAAYFTAESGLLYELVESGMMFILLIVELVVVFIANSVMRKGNTLLSGTMLLVYSIINGITLSFIFALYELGSIVTIFIIAAAVFGIMAVFGFVTQRSLTTLGSIGIMGIFGVLVLMVVNLFVRSNELSLLLSAVGLALFIGLTAYDMQRIKNLAKSNSVTNTTVLAMLGALILYLDFVNIFIRLLRLFAKRN